MRLNLSLAALCWLFALTAHADQVAQPEHLAMPGGKLELHWQSAFSNKERQRLKSWLTDAGLSTSTLTGTFPLATTRVFIHRIERGKGPVPWAHTVRHGETEGVVFHVQPDKSLKSFKQDWTATHEFSHLYLPFIGRADSWLAEGFASYYQYILLMRRGTLDAQTGWQQLANGFARGAADPHQTGSLKQASASMRENRAFKRVYWSGALYFFEIDIALRARGSSLDQVIADFQKCCRLERRQWDGSALVEKLDKVSKTELFSSQYALYREYKGFPAYKPTFAKLGIEFVKDKNGPGKTRNRPQKIRLSGNEQKIKLRQAITQPPA